jgi:isopenicillin N synthase-like dioxygenase
MSLAALPCLRVERNPSATFSTALTDCLRRYGFAVVEDPGIDGALIDRVGAEARALFALPQSAKLGYRIAGGAGQRGYTPFAVETAKTTAHADLKEFWHIGRDIGEGAMNVWPSELPPFRDDAVELYAAFEHLGVRLLSAIGAGLGLPTGLLEEAVRDGDSVLRLLRYPSGDFAGPSLRAAAHEDINAITLLLGAEEAGLEILDRDGVWLAVDPPPGAVVVNVGDMLARLTNEVLPSTTHRVVNPAKERRGIARYSMPFFLHFRGDFLIRTRPECIAPERPDRFAEPIYARAFLEQRLREIRLA